MFLFHVTIQEIQIAKKKEFELKSVSVPLQKEIKRNINATTSEFV